MKKNVANFAPAETPGRKTLAAENQNSVGICGYFSIGAPGCPFPSSQALTFLSGTDLAQSADIPVRSNSRKPARGQLRRALRMASYGGQGCRHSVKQVLLCTTPVVRRGGNKSASHCGLPFTRPQHGPLPPGFEPFHRRGMNQQATAIQPWDPNSAGSSLLEPSGPTIFESPNRHSWRAKPTSCVETPHVFSPIFHPKKASKCPILLAGSRL